MAVICSTAAADSSRLAAVRSVREASSPEAPAISALAASALAYAGEKERALAEFARLLRVPFGTNPILDRGIWTGSWKPLRDDPRFAPEARADHRHEMLDIIRDWVASFDRVEDLQARLD